LRLTAISGAFRAAQSRQPGTRFSPRGERIVNADKDTLINELGFFEGSTLKHGIRTPP
jgi:hypothetical protein